MGLFDFVKKILPDEKSAAKRARKATKKKITTSRKATPRPAKVKTGGPKEKEIGVITHYFGKISVGIIKLRTPLCVGEKIHIKGAHDDFTQEIKSMQVEHQDVTQAKKGAEVGIKVTQRVHVNDKVFLVSEQ